MMAASMESKEGNDDVQINIQEDPNGEMSTNLASSDATHANDASTVPFVPSQLFNLARRTLESMYHSLLS